MRQIGYAGHRPQIIQQVKWLGFTLSFRDVQNMFAKRGGGKVEVMAPLPARTPSPFHHWSRRLDRARRPRH